MNLISVIYSTTPHTGWQSSRVFSLEFYGAQEKPLSFTQRQRVVRLTASSSIMWLIQNQSLGLMEETDIA